MGAAILIFLSKMSLRIIKDDLLIAFILIPTVALLVRVSIFSDILAGLLHSSLVPFKAIQNSTRVFLYNERS